MVIGGYSFKSFKNTEGEQIEYYEVLLLDSYAKPEKGAKEGCYATKINLGVKKFEKFAIAECFRNNTPVTLGYDQYKKPLITHA